MKTFIQIGLLSTAEYSYLTNADPCPDSIGNKCLVFYSNDNWQYVGVEINPLFCYNTANKYRGQKRTFVCAGLGARSKIQRVNVPTDDNMHMPMHSVVMTINDLVRQLNIKSLDGVYIDIEGQEMEILRNYDWEFKPEFFGVEVHDFKENGKALEDNAKEIQCILEGQGYKISLKKNTNSDRTMELQFTR